MISTSYEVGLSYKTNVVKRKEREVSLLYKTNVKRREKERGLQ